MYIQKDTRYYEHCSTKIITTGTTSSVPFAEMRPSDPNHQSNGLKPAPRARERLEERVAPSQPGA